MHHFFSFSVFLVAEFHYTIEREREREMGNSYLERREKREREGIVISKGYEKKKQVRLIWNSCG